MEQNQLYPLSRDAQNRLMEIASIERRLFELIEKHNSNPNIRNLDLVNNQKEMYVKYLVR